MILVFLKTSNKLLLVRHTLLARDIWVIMIQCSKYIQINYMCRFNWDNIISIQSLNFTMRHCDSTYTNYRAWGSTMFHLGFSRNINIQLIMTKAYRRRYFDRKKFLQKWRIGRFGDSWAITSAAIVDSFAWTLLSLGSLTPWWGSCVLVSPIGRRRGVLGFSLASWSW